MNVLAERVLAMDTPCEASPRAGSGMAQPMLAGDDEEARHAARHIKPTGKYITEMSLDDSRSVAKRWHEEAEKTRQLLWVEVPRYGHWFPAGKSKAHVLGGWAFALLVKLFPVFDWFPRMLKDKSTRWESLCGDVLAGVTVCIMLIPQSMSYAKIAGLDYKYGLYTGMVPLMLYACTCSSRQIQVGPVAIVSLLMEAVLDGFLTDDECPKPKDFKDGTPQWEYCQDAYAQAAMVTTLIAGLYQLAAAALQLGFLVSFLSAPVISGFTTGASITIAFSQVQYLVGYKVPRSNHLNETLYNIFRWDQLKNFNYVTFLLGTSFWFALWAARKISAKHKRWFGWLKPCAPLAICIIGILVGGNFNQFGGCGFVQCAGAEGKNVRLVVGPITPGLPPYEPLNLSMFSRASGPAISVAIVSFMETIAIGRVYSAKHNYELRPGQELYAMGISKVVASFFGCYATTASFSRSSVNNACGARTPLAGFITGLLMVIVLAAITGLFYWLPLFVLAAVIIASVTPLMEFGEAFHLWRVKKFDFLLWVACFVGTMFWGVEESLYVCIGLNLIGVIFESVRPQLTVLWRLPGTPIYRNIKQDSDGVFVDNVLVVRVGSSMYYANVTFIRDRLKKLVDEFYAEAPGEGKAIKYIVVECTSVTSLDSQAMHEIGSLHREFLRRGIRVAFATVGNRLHRDLQRAGLIDKIGVRWIHASVHSAVEFCTAHRAHVEAGGDPDEPEESAGHGAAVHGGKTLVSWPAITARLRLPRREPRRPACTSDEAVPTESQAAAV